MQGQTPTNTGTRRIKSAAGVVEDWARDLIRTLVVKVGVPVMKVPAAFLPVAQALGVNVDDTVSDRTCRRIVLEGGVLAKTWLVKEINESASECYQPNNHMSEANAPHRPNNQRRRYNAPCNPVRVAPQYPPPSRVA